MPTLCCYWPPRLSHHDRGFSTPTTELPSRPALVNLSKPRLLGRGNQEHNARFNAAQAPSLMTTPRNQAALDPTVLEVDDSDSGDDERTNHKTSPPSTLGVLKTKLVRRLSHGSLPRRQSRQTIGDSREEIERRAELRRLRQRRIREELENEGDIETKSVEPGLVPCSTPVSSERHCGGPRDYLEFSICEVDDLSSESSSTVAQELIALALPILAGTNASIRRRSSCPTTVIQSSEASALVVEKSPRKHGSLPEMPTSPELEPVYLSDTGASSSIASWRLSYSAGQLAEYLGESEEEKDLQREDTILSGQNEKQAKHDSGSEAYSSGERSHENQHHRSVQDMPVIDRDIISTSSTTVRLDQDEKSTTAPSLNDESHFEQSTGVFHSTTNSEHNSPLDLWLRVSNTLQSLSHSPTRRNSDSVLEGRLDISNLGSPNSNGPPAAAKPSSASSKSGTESSLLKVPDSFPVTSKLAIYSSSGDCAGWSKDRGAVSFDVPRGAAVHTSSSSQYTTQPSSADLSKSGSTYGSSHRLERQCDDQSCASNSELQFTQLRCFQVSTDIFKNC